MKKVVLLLFILASLFALTGSSFATESERIPFLCKFTYTLAHDKYSGFPPPVPAGVSPSDTFYATTYSFCGWKVDEGKHCYWNTAHSEYKLGCKDVDYGKSSLSTSSSVKLDPRDPSQHVLVFYHGKHCYWDSVSKGVPVYLGWWK